MNKTQLFEEIKALVNELKIQSNSTSVNSTNYNVSKEDVMTKSGREIMEMLTKSYKEVQSTLDEVNSMSNETKQLFDMIERIYLIQYSLDCANMININNTQIVMNQITEQLDQFHYEADNLKVETDQIQIKDIKKEVQYRVEKKEALDRHITRVIDKLMWSIDRKTMIMIGKYLKSNQDYVNVMKVNKKYAKLTKEFTYNPISDCSLFKHMNIQHFYKMNDKKNRITNMEYYIYWYDDKIAEQQADSNEIFKYEIRKENNKGIKGNACIDFSEINNDHIEENVGLLEEWSGLSYDRIVYDSDKDGKNSEMFKQKVMDQEHLYFIVIDNQNNVFGHYHPSVIHGIRTDCIDNNIFMFTLFSNGRCEPKKFEGKGNLCTQLLQGERFYKVSYPKNDGNGVWLYEFDNIDRSNMGPLNNYFIGIVGTELTGRNCSLSTCQFTQKRIIVIQMN